MSPISTRFSLGKSTPAIRDIDNLRLFSVIVFCVFLRFRAETVENIYSPVNPLFSQFKRKASRFSALSVRKSAKFVHICAATFRNGEIHYNTTENCCQAILALSLLMALVFRTNHHNLSISLDDLALVAHRFYRRSDFHKSFLSYFLISRRKPHD